MKKLLVMSLLILVVVVVTVSAAYADCYKDGKAYPTGTVINGFICTESGKWVKV